MSSVLCSLFPVFYLLAPVLNTPLGYRRPAYVTDSKQASNMLVMSCHEPDTSS